MADYIREIQNGTMMIRDTGGDVQFWFKTGSSTYNNQQTWGYQANGGYSQQDYRLARGGAWQQFGAVYVGSRQNVMFRIIGEGLGWPTTDFEVFIERARQPDPPQQPYLVQASYDSIRVAFNYNYDGGLPIVEARIWYSFDGQPRYIANGRDAWISDGIAAKTNYSFWGEVRNDRGWSGLGPGAAFSTIGVPNQPPPPDVKATSPTSTEGRANLGWDGGTPIRESQVGYGTDPNTAQLFRSGVDCTFANLDPGKQYYFWSRARNDVGWGPWSARTDVLLPAGTWVQVNGVWRRALPWVKVGGVWKITRPFVLVNGAWRQAGS